ncbi:transcription initiation factor brf1 subunit-like protein [Vairimorpha apis BRL 01]|uniref:Transcription initiation factor brf1 subunit-like protein n=1 Tax=Vairimorpha apis BRL 01 TaxID=1037528 RepID=T0MDI7_9MICR|nr:transcription initiation factor brf1 subunit-like protein [Vairimorpha apis BRL 01]
MKSNLNTKILKLSIAEICIQLGFDKITEQSMNLLSDVLRYYIIQIWLKLGRYEQTNFYDIIIKNIFNDMLIAESYQEKELNIFTKAQNSVKKYYNENSNNKSLLHLLKILPNNQKFFNSNQNNNETHKNNFKQLSIEKNTKPQFFNEFREKDDILINFVEKCKTEFQKKIRLKKWKKQLFMILIFLNLFKKIKKKI